MVSDTQYRWIIDKLDGVMHALIHNVGMTENEAKVWLKDFVEERYSMPRHTRRVI